MLDDAFLLRARDVARHRLGVERRRVDVEPGAGLRQLAHDQADGEGQRRNNLKIHQRLDADPADLRHVPHRGDAVHHGAENDRADHHLDELDERVAQRLQRCAGLRMEVADADADRDRHQHLHVKDGIPAPVGGH